MYAIFETGGKQYKVSAGDVLRIEKIQGEVGGKVRFENVIAFSDDSGSLKTGTPYLDAATVNATITGAGKGEKVIVFKFKAKKDYRKKQGHRQPYTEIEIDGFSVGGKELGEKPEKPAKAEAEEQAASSAEQETEPVKEEKPAKRERVAKATETEKGPEQAPAEQETEVKAESEVIAKSETVKEEKTASKLTKADIMAKLDELGVDYAKSAKKDELLAILAEAEGK